MAELNEFLKLENALLQAGRELEFPATPALAARVRAEITPSLPQKNNSSTRVFGGVRRIWVPLVIAVLFALALLFALPTTRDAVAQFLGLRGLRIFYLTPTPVPTPTPPATPTVQPTVLSRAPSTNQRTPTIPAVTATARSLPIATPTVMPYTLCCLTTLQVAQKRAAFNLLSPPGDPPAEVYFQNVFDNGAQVVMVFGDASKPRFTLYQAERWIYGKLIGKGAGDTTVIGETQVRGERALWFSGGAHVVMTLDPSGKPIYDTQRVVEGNTLVWETGTDDRGVIYRLETSASLHDARQFAESLQEVNP